MEFSGSDYQGKGGGFVTLEDGTYPVTLKAARMYKNNEYGKDPDDPANLMVQIGLIWDTGLVVENDDGEDVEAVIFDDWIRFSLNEKANLVKRLAAIMGAGFDPETAKVRLELEDGITSLDDLPYWREQKVGVTTFELNGETVFGREALVTIAANDKGYSKVTNISSPPKAGGGKAKARPKAAPPAGAPV